MAQIHEKKQFLENYLTSLGSVAVAFSSGVDSTFLLKTAHDVLGDCALAVTAQSASFPRREQEEAKAFCEAEGIKQIFVQSRELDIEGFRQNPVNRCYLCKRELFTKIKEIAASQGMAHVAEGSNMDDTGDYRPGLIAVAELGVKSPLREARLGKEEIRLLSKELGLPTWDKPSFACLATRFVYGETISEEKLAMVEKAEQRLFDLGFRQVRVRIHDKLARIEVLPEEFSKLLENAGEIDTYFRALGFAYASLDLGGYRMGSMNRTLSSSEWEAAKA